MNIPDNPLFVFSIDAEYKSKSDQKGYYIGSIHYAFADNSKEALQIAEEWCLKQDFITYSITDCTEQINIAFLNKCGKIINQK